MTISEEVLMGFAGVAIALIGFSGVVTALGRRGTGQWSRPEMLQLRTLVEPSIVVLFAAFVPITLGLLTDDLELLWRMANGVLLFGYCLGVGAFLSRASPETIHVSQKVMTVIAIVVMVGLLSSSLGYFGSYAFTFCLGLLHSMLVSVHNFYLLFFPANEETA